MTRRSIFALSAILAAGAAPASAQLRAGPEFRVSSYTTADQIIPGVAQRKSELVVVWQSYGEDGDHYGIFGQAYRDDGSPLGAQFRVNAVTAGPQASPVAAHDGNEFVVAWSTDQDGSGSSVAARRFRKDGTPIGGDFQVNAYTTGYQFVTSIAKGRRNGRRAGFVVVWDDPGQDQGSVMARRFDEQGVPLGGDFRVNANGPDAQFGGRVAMVEDGRFVVVWASYGQDGDGLGVFGRRFDAAGNPLGGEFRVNTVTTGDQYPGSVAMASDGTFVVAWEQGDGSYLGARARRFDDAGQPQGPELQVNTYTTYNQERPRVAVNERGDFTIVWMSNGPKTGNSLGVYGQHFDKLGARLGAEFRANTYTTDDQRDPSVGVDEVGNFVVAWASRYQDGDGHGIYAQRFGGILFAGMAVDTTASQTSDGNGVLEPDEKVTIETFWRNVNGAALGPLSGLVIHFGGFENGPPPPIYDMPDPNAGFGTIPNGATVGCSVTQNCYFAGVSGPRIFKHWDAVMEERVASLVPQQHKRWIIHLGDSFAVPRTSPFYRFIETIFHHGVTTGCGGGYCPADPTTREQMAVFVLVAREGAGYLPPACTTPVFADVPASSPFCRFVEELFRRGVVSGCGGGNYCPSDPVTREQMAVFVLSTLDAAIDPPACVPPNLFADVPETSPFCRWIEELANRGVVSGCGGGNYCPASPVTREQMAVFLTVTFGLKLYGP